MKKMLRTKDKLMTILAYAGDLMIIGYTRSHGFGWRKSLAQSLFVEKNTLNKAVSDLLKTGDIEKIIDKKGNACFRLTSSGQESFERLFPIHRLSRQPWDGKWRVVIFDIEEKEKKTRNALRLKLISLGFGELQKSVYVTPLDVLPDIKEFLRENGLLGKVLVFEAKELLGYSPKTIAGYVWKLNRLNEKYKDLIDDSKNLHLDNEVDMKKNREKLFELIRQDPLLPEELLPDDWQGSKIKKILLKK